MKWNGNDEHGLAPNEVYNSFQIGIDYPQDAAAGKMCYDLADSNLLFDVWTKWGKMRWAYQEPQHWLSYLFFFFFLNFPTWYDGMISHLQGHYRSTIADYLSEH